MTLVLTYSSEGKTIVSSCEPVPPTLKFLVELSSPCELFINQGDSSPTSTPLDPCDAVLVRYLMYVHYDLSCVFPLK